MKRLVLSLSLIACRSSSAPDLPDAPIDAAPVTAPGVGPVTFQKLAPTGDGRATFFGSKVVAAGGLIVVAAIGDGAPASADPGGSISIFEYSFTTGLFERVGYVHGDGLYEFGRAVATDGVTIAVGAPGTIARQPGGVHVFDRQADGAWRSAGRLVSSSIPEEGLGAALAIDGDRLFASGTTGVAVFERTGPGAPWIETTTLARPAAASETFGVTLAADAGRVVVGDLFLRNSIDPRTPGGGLVCGHDGNAWHLQATLVPDETFRSFFGTGVALHGDTAAVGSTLDSSVYVFARGSDGAWTSRAWLSVDRPPVPSMRLGDVIAFAGADEVVLGLSTSVSPNPGETGAALRFRTDATGTWLGDGELVPPAGLSSGDNFGCSIAITDELLVVGADLDDAACRLSSCNAGAAYIFPRH